MADRHPAYGSLAQDELVNCRHSSLLHAAYGGEKALMHFEGDHNARRPETFYSRVSAFFHTALRLDEVLLPEPEPQPQPVPVTTRWGACRIFGTACSYLTCLDRRSPMQMAFCPSPRLCHIALQICQRTYANDPIPVLLLMHSSSGKATNRGSLGACLATADSAAAAALAADLAAAATSDARSSASNATDGESSGAGLSADGVDAEGDSAMFVVPEEAILEELDPEEQAELLEYLETEAAGASRAQAHAAAASAGVCLVGGHGTRGGARGRAQGGVAVSHAAVGQGAVVVGALVLQWCCMQRLERCTCAAGKWRHITSAVSLTLYVCRCPSCRLPRGARIALQPAGGQQAGGRQPRLALVCLPARHDGGRAGQRGHRAVRGWALVVLLGCSGRVWPQWW